MTNTPTKFAITPPEFSIQQIYLKDASLESPRSPQIFQEEWKPELNLQFSMNTNKLADSQYESILQITATASVQGKTIFLIEIKQAGFFTLKGFTDEQIQQTLSITCPTILFPYAREAISNLVTKAGFPSLYLSPVNFEALYTQQAQAQHDETIH